MMREPSAAKPLLYWAMTRTASPWCTRLEVAVCVIIMVAAHVLVSRLDPVALRCWHQVPIPL